MTEDELYDEVTELLKNVEDPEIGINIIDLGLVYSIDISKIAVAITITLTSAACPLQDYIQEDMRNVLGTSPHVDRPVYFNWVFSPPWVPAMMSDEGREMLSALGGYIPTY